MEQLWKNSQWIWKQGPVTADDYAQFAGDFTWDEKGPVALYLSADSNVNVYLNGKLVFFKQCSDYPHYKLYDRVDITPHCGRENRLQIDVWYYGKDNACYYTGKPGLIFEVWQAERLLLASTPELPSRPDVRYRTGYCKDITGQLGFSFFYDNTAENTLPYEPSVPVAKTMALRCNPLQPLQLLERCQSKLLRQDERCALVDLGREETGFLTLELDSPVSQTVTITYGEHIADGGVRQKIGVRDFSMELILKPGKNTYRNTFRRLAGRYLELFYEHPVTVGYLGLTPVVYPVVKKPFTAQSPLQQQIYDTALRTLELCMHEHYEDCPWREQALYVLDSRNQMLCGYHCFEGYAYARENLLLIAQGQKADGLLELTYPAQNTPAIPFFSLMYPVAVWEYVEHSGDRSILDVLLPVMTRILDVFEKKASEGLIANLPYPYWNFYEWSQGSDNADELDRTAETPDTRQYDLILNCAYLVSRSCYDALTGRKTDMSALRQKIHDTFYDPAQGLYCAGTAERSLYTVLGNSMAILSGVAEGEQAKELAQKLRSGENLVPATLSMLGFQYDALLKVDPENRTFVLENIEEIYGNMLQAGATSFWETANGQEDFEGAASLCHGWSAMPVYYFHRLSPSEAVR